MKNLHDIRTEYSAKPLVPEELHIDPAAQFTEWFSEVEKLDIIDSNAATLSTFDSKNNRVRSRIVLIKEITPVGIIFFSNYESAKGNEIFFHPQASMTIYWPSMFRQVRFEGIITKTSAKISDDYFYSRPRKSQISAIISNQSMMVKSRQELEKKYDELSHSEQPLVRPQYWGGYELKADFWEFWQGRNHRLHDRICYQKNQATNIWQKSILAP